MALIILSLGIIFFTQVVFMYYASYVNESAVVIHPYIDAYLGGYGNTVYAELALLFALILLLRFWLSRTKSQNTAANILKGLSGKLIGIVNFLILLMALFGNGVLIYLKIIEKNPIQIAVTGNGYAEIGIVFCMIGAFSVSRRTLSQK
jgi:hypothetical protein